jgi:hypothetical protein
MVGKIVLNQYRLSHIEGATAHNMRQVVIEEFAALHQSFQRLRSEAESDKQRWKSIQLLPCLTRSAKRQDQRAALNPAEHEGAQHFRSGAVPARDFPLDVAL